MNFPSRRLLLPALLMTLALWQCSTVDSVPGRASGGVNAPENTGKPYLVLISIDGFRWDFADLYEAPAINSIAARGLKAEALQPVFPTLTFPNHYSIATGMLPSGHGVVANEFPGNDGKSWYHYKDRSTVQDGSWYLAEPVWVTAEKHGMVTAAYFFVGTEADVSGIRPTYWNAFNAEHSGEMRVHQVLDWLSKPEERRPHVITLYFEEVDETTHWYGPGSEQSISAIGNVDRQIGQLLQGISELPYADRIYVLLVSDHGQAAYDRDRPLLVLDHIVDLEGTRIAEGGAYAFIHFKEPPGERLTAMRDTINAHWDCGLALFPSEAPAAWRLDVSARLPDLIVQADPGCSVVSTSSKQYKITQGDHGWPPEMPEMKGVFYAMGPRIAAGTRIGTVQVTDIYPLMLSILGLPPAQSFDGDPELLPSLLLPPAANTSQGQ